MSRAPRPSSSEEQQQKANPILRPSSTKSELNSAVSISTGQAGKAELTASTASSGTRPTMAPSVAILAMNSGTLRHVDHPPTPLYSPLRPFTGGSPSPISLAAGTSPSSSTSSRRSPGLPPQSPTFQPGALGGGGAAAEMASVRTAKFNHQKKCRVPECSKYAQSGGVCVSHGAKVPIYHCRVASCDNRAVSGGICIAHGAKRKRSRCKIAACEKYAQRGGMCKAHGATYLRAGGAKSRPASGKKGSAMRGIQTASPTRPYLSADSSGSKEETFSSFMPSQARTSIQHDLAGQNQALLPTGMRYCQGNETDHGSLEDTLLRGSPQLQMVAHQMPVTTNWNLSLTVPPIAQCKTEGAGSCRCPGVEVSSPSWPPQSPLLSDSAKIWPPPLVVEGKPRQDKQLLLRANTQLQRLRLSSKGEPFLPSSEEPHQLQTRRVEPISLSSPSSRYQQPGDGRNSPTSAHSHSKAEGKKSDLQFILNRRS